LRTSNHSTTDTGIPEPKRVIINEGWYYPEKDFLAKPVYTRDYPPAKYLEN
jgi:hypothetical protein